MERRSLLKSVLGFFGFGLVAKGVDASFIPITKESRGEDYAGQKKGVFVYTINVGNLPPFKAEAFIERVKDQLKKKRNGAFPFDEMFLPVRPMQQSRVDVFLYSADAKVPAPHLIFDPSLPMEEVTPEERERLKKQAIEFVCLMLGAPVMRVELDRVVLEKLWEKCWEEVQSYADSKKHPTILSTVGARGARAQDMLLAYAKMALGRVRVRFPRLGKNLSVPDGETLLIEGKDDLASCREMLALL